MKNTFYGILFVGIFSLFATLLAELDFFRNLGISSLIIGIVLGIFYANTIKHKFLDFGKSGIIFSTEPLADYKKQPVI